MKCRPCKGSGKVEVENGAPDNLIEEKCDDCRGTGERNLNITITIYDEDNECDIASETTDFSYEFAAEAVARLVKYAQEN